MCFLELIDKKNEIMYKKDINFRIFKWRDYIIILEYFVGFIEFILILRL